MTIDPTVQVFFDEAFELLHAFEEGVLELETTPDDPDLLNSIFRAAHTLKGNSSMLGYDRIAALTHRLEELLTRLRAGTIHATPGVVNTLLGAGDVLRELLGQACDGEERDIDGLADLSAALAAHAAGKVPGPGPQPAIAAVPAAPAPVATGPRTLYEVRFAPPGSVLRRGLDPQLILEALLALGEPLRVMAEPTAVPPLELVEDERSYLAFHCWLMTRAPRAELEACFEFVDDEPGAIRIEGLEIDDEPSPQGGDAGVGTAVGGPAGGSRLDTVLAARAGRDTVPAHAAGNGRPKSGAADESQSIRVATEKVDRLVNLVGELVIAQSIVAQLLEGFTPERLPRLKEAVTQMDRHSRDLQERVMAVRMLPIRTVFGRFARVVRDLSQTLGKRVEFTTHGDETEVDKTVIERIGDPLTHLVRNAVDHGLESPEERREAGKAETGHLSLAAYQAGGSIYIEIVDDGGGLDRERILAKAIDQRLVDGSDSLTDEQVNALIFRPGFSTARAVTEVSGRGVGLDVVKSNVEALGGSISIVSRPGQGTTFRVKLPLTLAILEGQLVRVGAETYALPLVNITESVRPTRETVTAVLGTGEALVRRDQVLPLVRLHRMFSVPAAVEDPTRALTVVVEHDGQQVALLVDELLGQQQVVIKSLETHFRRIDGLSGATILGDGRVALILDVPGLVKLACPRSQTGRAA